MTSPRLRIFAGPNGSGKSTIKAKVVESNPRILGVYINPDEIEREILSSGHIDFANFKVETTADHLFRSLNTSTFLREKISPREVSRLRFSKNSLSFEDVSLNSHLVSMIADFLHESLVASRTSFSLETVMSHKNKIELLKRSRSAGFRNYLYYVATEDPEINISRVQIRVKEGGHDVAHDRVVDRYYKSLENLLDAVRTTDRAYIFDNSGAEATHIAEITGGKDIEIKNSNVPVWFKKYVLDKGT
jgi:predicted ABC-type ATPase